MSVVTKGTTETREPPDRKRCQTMRPSGWPQMPSFMTLGPVSYRRCENQPAWLASDGVGTMSLCGECKDVCEKVMGKGTTFEPIKVRRRR